MVACPDQQPPRHRSHCPLAAALVSGTLRGFTETAASLYRGIVAPNANIGMSVSVSTYSDRDCQPDACAAGTSGACKQRIVHSLTKEPLPSTCKGVAAVYAANNVTIHAMRVDDYNHSQTALPRQKLFQHWHGALERLSSQYLLRSRALSLAIEAGCAPELAIIVRPDMELTSTWRFAQDFSPTPARWSVTVSVGSGECVHALDEDVVVVPRANGAGSFPDDTFAAGTLPAIARYIQLRGELENGTYAKAAIEKPELLLRHHLLASGLRIQYACGGGSWRSETATCPPHPRVAPSKHLIPDVKGRCTNVITGLGHLMNRHNTCTDPVRRRIP